MSREVMQMALDMLNEIADDVYCDQKLEGVITALRQALEEKQEPVAWISEGGDVSRSKRYMDEMGFKCNPLYTAPPKKEWVGLTDEERHNIREWQEIQKELGPVWAPMMLYLYLAIEQALKEKNHG